MKTFKEMEDEFYRQVRAELLSGLMKCTEDNRHKFALMYASGKQREKVLAKEPFSIKFIVAHMAKDKLEWAMEQARRTLEINDETETNKKTIPERDRQET